MKNIIKISVVLTIICVIAALCITSINLLTAPIIANNNAKKELALCQEIFSEYDSSKSIIVSDISDTIEKKITAKNSSDVLLGYVYRVAGKNSYGEIVLLVGIDENNNLLNVEFLTNGQSYATAVANHVTKEYSSGLSLDQVTEIDTTCSATYGAKLVKSLVSSALDDAIGGTN